MCFFVRCSKTESSKEVQFKDCSQRFRKNYCDKIALCSALKYFAPLVYDLSFQNPKMDGVKKERQKGKKCKAVNKDQQTINKRKINTQTCRRKSPRLASKSMKFNQNQVRTINVTTLYF